MNRIGIGAMAILALLLLFVGVRTPQAANAQPQAGQAANAAQTDEDGSIVIANDEMDNESPSVLVSVYHSGAMVRSSDCTATTGITWDKVPVGDYEVRFEAVGMTTVIKRVHVAAGDSVRLSAKLPPGKALVVLGGSPSLHEITARLSKLEATVAGMHKK